MTMNEFLEVKTWNAMQGICLRSMDTNKVHGYQTINAMPTKFIFYKY